MTELRQRLQPARPCTKTLFIGTSDNIARGSMQSVSSNNPGREPEIVQIEMSEAAESILTRKGGVLTVDFIKPLG